MVLTANIISANSSSEERRKRLSEGLVAPVVSNFFPLERYYEAADKVFNELQQISRLVQSQPEAFIPIEDVKDDDTVDLHYDEAFNQGLDMCYVYGKRYCIFCQNEIPKHHYYNSIKYQSLKQKHTIQMSKVVRALEHIVKQMDVQEKICQILKARKDREVQLELQDWQQRIQQTSSSSLNQNQNNSTSSIQASALEKLKLLAQSPPSVIQNTETVPPIKPSTSSTRYSLPDSDDDDEPDRNDDEPHVPNHAISLDGMQPLLPPTSSSSFAAAPSLSSVNHETMGVVPLRPPIPPSYESLVAAFQKSKQPDRTDASYIKPPPPIVEKQQQGRPEQSLPKQYTKPKEAQQLPPSMRQLQDYYKAMYNNYQQIGKIQVSSIDTYQGRVSDSTNGCTVISALVVARHLQDRKPCSMISNSTVQSIIDQQCGPILRVIRKKLGLGGHALIIPSDVHDHLVDEKILLQEYFAGAAGGNIMKKEHYTEFLQLLSNTDKEDSNGKAGATLFFREHVISIVKSVDNTTNESYYDLIDSMPGLYMGGKSMATRTRCYDVKALEVLLLWYASRKFSDSNCNYIDHTPWDDNTADLDPRVFQGFVWST